MTDSQTAQEIRGVLIQVGGGRLLLPNATISEVLSFADPNPAPPSQLPEFLRRLDLDFNLQTVEPFRVDNNVAEKLEATADLWLSGTVGMCMRN